MCVGDGLAGMNEVKEKAYLDYHDGFVVESAKLAKQVIQRQTEAIACARAKETATETVNELDFDGI